MASGSMPDRMQERHARSLPRRAVLAALLSVLVAGAAFPGDTRADAPGRPVPEDLGADVGGAATDHAHPGEPIADETGTDPEKVPIGRARPEGPVAPVADGAGTSRERTTTGEPVADDPGTEDPEKVPLGRAHAGGAFAPVPNGAGTSRERTTTGEPVADDLGTDPEKVALVRAHPEGSVTPLPNEAGTNRERTTTGEARVWEPIKPIPDDPGTDPGKVALGRMLFHDPRLSKDNTTACVSCHDLGAGGDDGRKFSIGVEGKEGTINAPTVFNAGLNFRQFWDGRARTLEHQIDGPVQSPVELGSLWPEVIAKLHEHESYPGRFDALYPDGINRKNVKDALAEFMRSLVTPNSRFDQWLKGDDGALTALEEHGYALFKHYGCISCHQGANVGGNMFQVFGVLNEYFKRRGGITEADYGRYNLTGNPADRHAFKVPSLRMAVHTAPYLHDGNAATLRDAVDAMFEYQLGREAPDEDKEAIVAFIKTLAGDNRELSP